RGGELVHFHGLGQVAVETRSRDPRSVADHGRCAQRDDGDVARLRPVPELIAGLDAAHPGQVDVHDDDVRTAHPRELDADLGRGGSDQLYALEVGQQILHEGNVGGIVLYV